MQKSQLIKMDRNEYYLVYPDDITEIIGEALDEVRGKIKKKFKDKYLEIAEKALQNLSTEKGGGE